MALIARGALDVGRRGRSADLPGDEYAVARAGLDTSNHKAAGLSDNTEDAIAQSRRSGPSDVG